MSPEHDVRHTPFSKSLSARCGQQVSRMEIAQAAGMP
jgi:hypothetical protein